MTNQELIKKLQFKLLSHIASDESVDTQDDYTEAIELIIKALKKQESKEPKIKNKQDILITKCFELDNLYCPTCDNYLNKSINNNIGFAYCPRCGQALSFVNPDYSIHLENITKEELINQLLKELNFYYNNNPDELYGCCRILVKLVPKKYIIRVICKFYRLRKTT